MDNAWLYALGLGVVSGLRTFTSLAAVFLLRGGVWGWVFTVGALAEYVVDLLPSTPSRTRPVGVVVRCVSGAVAGWTIVTLHGGSTLVGVILGVIGALIGTYGGHAARIAAIARIGGIPAGLLEDAVAIGLAALIVTR